MALYIARGNFNLARFLYVRPENFGPKLVKLLPLNYPSITSQTTLRHFEVVSIEKLV
jgi:hypothetical protein